MKASAPAVSGGLKLIRDPLKYILSSDETREINKQDDTKYRRIINGREERRSVRDTYKETYTKRINLNIGDRITKNNFIVKRGKFSILNSDPNKLNFTANETDKLIKGLYFANDKEFGDYITSIWNNLTIVEPQLTARARLTRAANTALAGGRQAVSNTTNRITQAASTAVNRGRQAGDNLADYIGSYFTSDYRNI